MLFLANRMSARDKDMGGRRRYNNVRYVKREKLNKDEDVASEDDDSPAQEDSNEPRFFDHLEKTSAEQVKPKENALAVPVEPVQGFNKRPQKDIIDMKFGKKNEAAKSVQKSHKRARKFGQTPSTVAILMSTITEHREERS